MGITGSSGYIHAEILNRSGRKGSGNRFADKLSNKVNLGLGGDVALRYRINKHLDAQLKGGMMWINNNKFDGIKTICNCKRNTMFTAQVGLVWK